MSGKNGEAVLFSAETRLRREDDGVRMDMWEPCGEAWEGKPEPDTMPVWCLMGCRMRGRG